MSTNTNQILLFARRLIVAQRLRDARDFAEHQNTVGAWQRYFRCRADWLRLANVEPETSPELYIKDGEL